MRDATLFYLTYLLVTGGAAAVVLEPSAPLIPILVLTQVLNAVLLPPLAFMYGISRDRDMMGPYTATPGAAGLYLATIGSSPRVCSGSAEPGLLAGALSAPQLAARFSGGGRRTGTRRGRPWSPSRWAVWLPDGTADRTSPNTGTSRP